MALFSAQILADIDMEEDSEEDKVGPSHNVSSTNIPSIFTSIISTILSSMS
jgi:hypothetical protein